MSISIVKMIRSRHADWSEEQVKAELDAWNGSAMDYLDDWERDEGQKKDACEHYHVQNDRFDGFFNLKTKTTTKEA